MARPAVGRNLSTVALNDPAADCQAQSHPIELQLVLPYQAFEGLKQLAGIGLVKSNAIVRDQDFKPCRFKLPG